MDADLGYETSFSGFIDYSQCYHDVPGLWIAVSSAIFIGTIISLTPQIFSIVSQRTSHGISHITAYITTIGQFILVVNYVCLHGADFVGILQYPTRIWVPRMMTFMNLMILWFMYLPVPFFTLIFYDKARGSGTKAFIHRIVSFVLVIIAVTALLVLWLIFGHYSFFGPAVNHYGQILGTLSSFLCLAQYLPQMITTFMLRDNGALSLIYLGLQAPGGLINSLFMWIGNGDHWTTWISIFLAACQQFIILGMCIFFKLTNRNRFVDVASLPDDDHHIQIDLDDEISEPIAH